MIEEIWKDVLGYEGRYQVSDQGRIKNYKLNRVFRQSDAKGGYLRVSLGGRSFQTHRLVAIAFISGDISLQVNHKDGVKTNNNANNLEWVTSKENIIHAHSTGLSNCWHLLGENHHRCIHSDEEVASIREAIKIKKGKDVATEFGVSRKYISKLKNNHIRKTSTHDIY